VDEVRIFMASTLSVGLGSERALLGRASWGQDIHGIDVTSWLTCGNERALFGEDPGNHEMTTTAALDNAIFNGEK
jgi:hypothetical protein